MKKLKWIMVVVMFLFIVSVVGGCTSNTGQVELQERDFSIKIVDGLGYSVEFNKLPKKLISNSPSQTEILFALGLGDQIIGVSEYCDYPKEALEKEKVGDAWAINLEKIIELMPDVVFIYGKGEAEIVELIQNVGIPVVRFMPESIEEIIECIEITGVITGKEEQAQKLVKEMMEKKNAIVEKVSKEKKVRVFYEIWDEPLMTAGPNSFIHQLITYAGGINVAEDAEGPYPQFSVETLVEKNPEVYLLPGYMGRKTELTEEEKIEMKRMIQQRPGYEEIDAIKNGRIELLEPNIVSRPGIRIIEALELIAKALHPELF